MNKWILSLSLAVMTFGCSSPHQSSKFVPLFPSEGIPTGWIVRGWANVKDPGPEGAAWKVKDGILHGGNPRGTWLVSEKEYGDFILEFEFMLPERGNSGCGVRFPLVGDPAFDGLEVQMVDLRYFPEGQPPRPDERTGGLYRAVAPADELLKPMEWNRYQITCKGPHVKVVLNGRPIIDVNLDQETKNPKRHDGTDAPPLKDRPRKGHIGFQELSRGGGNVQIRHARIREL